MGWMDRMAPHPEAVAIHRELPEVVQSAIDRLPPTQQRDTAA